jgi:hypothetical protein
MNSMDMNQKRSIRSLIAMAALLLGSATAFAHNGIEHVMGTVKTLTDTSITVETVKHEMKTIALDPTTTFIYKGSKASPKDLKLADRVAIDTKDDAQDKPHAISVKWGATTGVTSKTSDHKMDPKMKM